MLVADPQVTAFTPTWSNFTMGTSTTTGQYWRTGGRIIVFTATLTLASGFSVTGAPGVDLPVPAAAAPKPTQFKAFLEDANGSRFVAQVDAGQTTTYSGNLICWEMSATYARWGFVTSSVPFTWAVSDKITLSGQYFSAG